MGGFGAGGKGERGGPKAGDDAEIEAIVNKLYKGTHSAIIILSYKEGASTQMTDVNNKGQESNGG
jgi:hypothetical protein